MLFHEKPEKKESRNITPIVLNQLEDFQDIAEYLDISVDGVKKLHRQAINKIKGIVLANSFF